MINWGALPIGTVIPFPLNSWDGATGASEALSGIATSDIKVFKGTSMTERASTAGFTLMDTDGIDLDGIVGLGGVSIDTGDNTDSGFYAAGSLYYVVLSSITVDGQTVNPIIGAFRLTAAENVAGVPVADTTHAAGTAWGSGAITAGSIATGAIDADALATDAVTEITDAMKVALGVVSGTADSGTTTTMVDAALTQADNDYWVGSIIVFTSGTIANQARVITDFVPGTDTITFSPATTQAVGTNTYIIIPLGSVNVATWRAELPNSLNSGRVDARITAITSGAITAAAFSADAIDANAIAADAVTEIQSGLSTLDAAGVRTAIGLASANLDTQLGDLPTAAENADAVWDEPTADHLTAGTFGSSISLIPTTGDIAEAVVAESVDGAVTVAQSLRLANSANGAKLSGAATTSIAIRDLADTKNRIAATVDADGNRSAVTLDLT